jgi:hypothetical protein
VLAFVVRAREQKRSAHLRDKCHNNKIMSGLAAAPYAVKKNVKDGMEKHNGTRLLAADGLHLTPIIIS